MVKNSITRLVVVASLALSLVLSVLSFSPVASVNSFAAYGGDVPCDQFRNIDKRLKCLDKLKKKAEKDAKKALDKRMYESYNNLLSDINNLYWEIWNVLTYGEDY
jgi:hypothetical protein